ncbi:STAS domain-containing protein [Sediminicoccus sp. KRV36]|uniref:STAS domain-containing protein n=1 Tax=Sediminicoccus sp. KRV36 TaxID=3133721 RepID=UPI00200D1A2D|nr:STAS domain-containing protein [Sediminicoccus rosea]UPY38247.1 STAS domain-containing protein [Sediminicoccus rosea]
MDITETQEGAKAVAILDGRLDTATAALTETRLLTMLEKASVIADLSEVRYVSSAGLRVLLKAAKQAKATGASFAVVGLQPPVREVFEISGFDKIIPAYATRAEAAQA